jgi:hypothetical protein
VNYNYSLAAGSRDISIEFMWAGHKFPPLDSKLGLSSSILDRPTPTNPTQLSTVLYPLSVIRYPLSTIRYPLSAIHYPLSAIRYPLSAIHCPLSTIHYPLSTVRYPLSTILYPLSSHFSLKNEICSDFGVNDGDGDGNFIA